MSDGVVLGDDGRHRCAWGASTDGYRAYHDGEWGRPVERACVERAPERPVASIPEVEVLSRAVKDRYRALVLISAWCGLRRGELLGLRRRDIDLLRQTVRIERSMHQMEDGTLIVGPPKTDAGRRTVAIPPHIVPDIDAHLAEFVTTEPDALVFTGEKGGPVRPHVLQNEWTSAKTKVGTPQSHLHDLRHAGNTWAAATGASIKELMTRMGHANAAAALRYQHATADRDQAIARALSELARPADVVPIARKAVGARDRSAMTDSGAKGRSPRKGP